MSADSPSPYTAGSPRPSLPPKPGDPTQYINLLIAPEWRSGEHRAEWLIHGFSTRDGRLNGPDSLAQNSTPGDSFNLGFTAGEDPRHILRNRSHFMQALTTPTPGGALPQGFVTLRQMHSSLVRRVGRSDIADQASLWGDGLMTDEPGVLLAIQTADCLPVLIVDSRQRAVTALHAGWRGTLKGIVEEGIASMQSEFGSDPLDLSAAIGPGIGSCCFRVGPEVQRLFGARYSYAEELFLPGVNLRLDLVEANRRQLQAAGVPAESIFQVGECTCCRSDRFFSYRAEGGKTGRMLAAIGIQR